MLLLFCIIGWFSFFGWTWSVAPWTMFDRQCSSERQFKWRTTPHPLSASCLLVSDLQTSLGHDPRLHGFHAWLAWLNNNTFDVLFFFFLDLFRSPSSYELCTPSVRSLVVFFRLWVKSVIVCSPNKLNILTDVVDKSSDCNWTTTALLHQWCPWYPAHLALAIWM